MLPCLRLTFLIGLVLPVAARGGEDENWQRLRSMPRERRVFLSEKIKEFDLLPGAEKTAVRTLDEKINELSPAKQAHYRSVLRRYHLWLRSQPEARRKQLEAASPDERLALVNQFRASERKSPDVVFTPLPFQLAGPSAFDVARRLQPWFYLSPAERAAVEKMNPVPRKKKLADVISQKHPKPIAHYSKEDEEKLLAKLEADPLVKGANNAAVKKQDPSKTVLEKAKQEHRERQRLDNYYFVVHPPREVDPDRLLLFESSLPSWFRSPFDDLPPDEARRRLTILYRLIFPVPDEIPPAGAAMVSKGTEAKPHAASEPGRSKPTPAPPKGAPF